MVIRPLKIDSCLFSDEKRKSPTRAFEIDEKVKCTLNTDCLKSLMEGSGEWDDRVAHVRIFNNRSKKHTCVYVGVQLYSERCNSKNAVLLL